MAGTELILKNWSEVAIESENFAQMRQDFNIAIQRMIENMMRSSEQEGSIALKVDISMRREKIKNTDPDLQVSEREIFIPSFSHKVTTQVTLKDEHKGAVNPEMELVYDEEGRRYVLRYVANTEQMSIFDKEFTEPQEQESEPELQEAETDPDDASAESEATADGPEDSSERADVWVNVETGEIVEGRPEPAEEMADGFMNIPEEPYAVEPDDGYMYSLPD